jgi:leucyl aminopeptidase
VAEGFLLGAYRMRKYLTGEERREGETLRAGVFACPPGDLAGARRGVRSALLLSRAANLARDLVNEPAMFLTPVRMAEIASALASRAGLECRVHDEKALEQMRMGAFLGVSRGSHQPPRLIHLVYRPPEKPSRKVILIGKGLTFDSGGLSLKTSAGMETMKLDKAGASAVLATMLSLPELRPPAEVHGLMGMTENMPGGSAIKPGDIVTTCGGKTIEVLNTDAEGRLVLADLLCHARDLGADEIIDLATLTGACMVALGPLAGGLFSNDAALGDRLLAAARTAGEKLWPMPLYEEYRSQIRSEMADVKNTGERYGGAITAALFLKEFVGRATPWAHLDIAGPAFLEANCHPYMRKGATGAGVRTLLTYLAGPEERS